ncbi:SAP domain-containing ribonucleoprotein isoform X3 [Neoarius graeffei]|uniref:SAP domain-containing ribonucleoprotein isoform X3 n=1 Tax=Neoarius graeffei TaxID=443677 RepID=UPI00298CC602|nr:SAP domain-containing ribonucleoprotein isoform X3 [Neoarius graeffei]
MAEVVELHKLKLAELKQECALRGLEVKGNKGDLIARLQAYIDEHEEDVNEEEVLEEFTEEAAAPEVEAQEELPPPDTFGLPVTSASSKGIAAVSKTNVDVEVLKKRAERFGMNVSSVSRKVEEDEKLKKRKERFGIVTSAASVGADDSEAKKRKRAERFGNV